jgi:PhoPQ-activated pathogenicity-related protein
LIQIKHAHHHFQQSLTAIALVATSTVADPDIRCGAGVTVKPTLIDQYRCAHLRIPMDMMRQGWAMILFQASQHWSRMSG